MTPPHYQTPVSPWDLQKHMHTSGDAFVDARRCDAIKYIFRDKENLLEDLKKAKHCIEAAIAKLEPKTKDAGFFAALHATPPSIFFKNKTLDGTKELSSKGLSGCLTEAMIELHKEAIKPVKAPLGPTGSDGGCCHIGFTDSIPKLHT